MKNKIKHFILSILTTLFVLGSTTASATVTGGYYPLKIVNKAANSKNVQHTYLLLLAQDWTAAQNNCVISLSYDASRNAQVATLIPITQSTNSKQYTYAIDSLQGYDSTTQSVLIYIPHLQSGRCMVSINYELYMPPVAGSTGIMSLQDPSVSDTSDINYDVVYDKFEFTYDTTGTRGCVYINPTAVDFFSIPIKLERDNVKSGNINDLKRDVIVDTIMSVLNKYDLTPTHTWQSLIVKDSSVIRMTSPSLAIGFDTSYLSGQSYNFIDTLIEYYKSNTLYVDCSEISAGYYGGTIDSSNNWNFVNGNNKVSINMNTVKTTNFFGPGTAPFATPNRTVESILVKNITSAFTVNMLPDVNGDTLEKPFNSAKFYKVNPRQNTPTTVGPWYNLYTRALHTAIGNSIYAFAYDDVLGQDGTLSGRDTTKTITVTIGDLGNMYIPPHKDLLHVYAPTIKTNTGFVCGDSLCTLRVTWKNPPTAASPYKQPENAKYFIMLAGSDSAGFNIPADSIVSLQQGHFYSYTDTCGVLVLPKSVLTGNYALLAQVMACGGPESPSTGSSSVILANAHGSSVIAPNVPSPGSCSCATTPAPPNKCNLKCQLIRIWCCIFGCKDN